MFHRETAPATLRPAEIRPLFSRASFDLIVIAASTGGLGALRQVVTALPPDFPAAVAIVQHLSPAFPSHMPELLGLRTRIDVRFAREDERPHAGTVYFAPPDRHLLIGEDRRFVLSRDDRINYVRPAADPLFTTAAAAFGPRVLAVVLTGMGCDGAAGVQAVRCSGGTVLVQDPLTADAFAMPEAALATGAVDLTLPLEAIGNALVSLVMVPGAAALFGVPRFAA